MKKPLTVLISEEVQKDFRKLVIDKHGTLKGNGNLSNEVEIAMKKHLMREKLKVKK